MSARWSPARKVAAVTLTAATGFYLGAVSKNTTPHGADRARWETPATILVTPATRPAVRVTPTTRCQEDMPCWDCTTMGNRICGTLPRVP